MLKIQFVWTRYGDSIAIGIRNKGESAGVLEKIYNVFFNYELTNGKLFVMNEEKFAYFLIKEESQLKKIAKIKSILAGKVTSCLRSSFDREEFLREY